MYCQKLDWKLKYVRNRSILCFHEDILSFISSLCVAPIHLMRSRHRLNNWRCNCRLPPPPPLRRYLQQVCTWSKAEVVAAEEAALLSCRPPPPRLQGNNTDPPQQNAEQQRLFTLQFRWVKFNLCLLCRRNFCTLRLVKKMSSVQFFIIMVLLMAQKAFGFNQKIACRILCLESLIMFLKSTKKSAK